LATFRIATWNLWNHDWRRADRLDAAIGVLDTANPDLVALQGVPLEPGATSGLAWRGHGVEGCDGPFVTIVSEEGLAVHSRV
jgi:hypothetical protein